MSCFMRKPYFSNGESRDADQLCTAQLISTFVFASCIVQSLFFNPKFQAEYTDQFVSDLFGDPKTSFLMMQHIS